MSLAPIAFAALQYEDFAGQYLKAFEQGTTTPKAMATDITGVTTASKFQLNAQGFPVTAGSALVIPFIEGAYDLWIIPTAIEADNNDTTNALQIADNIVTFVVGKVSGQESTVATMTANTNDTYIVGSVIDVAERTTGNGGAGTWDAVLTSSVTPNTFNIVIGVSDTTISFVLRLKNIVEGAVFEGLPVTAAGINAGLLLFATSTGTFLLPEGDFGMDADINLTDRGVRLRGAFASYAGGGTNLIANNSAGNALITIGDGVTLVNDCAVEDLRVTAGTNTSGIGVLVDFSQHSNLRHLRIDDFITGQAVKIKGQTSGGGASIANSGHDIYTRNNLVGILWTGEDANNTSAADEGIWEDIWIQLNGVVNAKGLHFEKGGNNTVNRWSVVDSTGFASGTIGVEFGGLSSTGIASSHDNRLTSGVIEKATTTVKYGSETNMNVLPGLRYVNTIGPVDDLSGGANITRNIRPALNQVEKNTYHTSISNQNFLPNSEFEKWTAGTSVAPDDWLAGGGVAVARDSSNQRKGSFSASLTGTGTLNSSLNSFDHLKGQHTSFGVWVKASAVTNTRIAINDGISLTRSGYHSGSGLYEFLAIRKKIDASASELTVTITKDEATVSYVDQAISVEGLEIPLPSAAPILESDRVHFTTNIDPLNILDGAQQVISTSVTGAAFGDFVTVAPGVDLQGLTMGAPYVSSADNVDFVLSNNTGGAINLVFSSWGFLLTRANPQ